MTSLRDVGRFFYGQIFVTPPIPQANLEGQTIIVTGATAGLGLEACKILISLNLSNLIMAVRNIPKGEKVRAELLDLGKKSGKRPNIQVMELDMASYSSVIAFAERCKTIPRIDGILENAGVHSGPFSTLEGDEATVTINVLSTFLLAILMLPVLRRSAEQFNITPRISIVGSAVHYWAQRNEILESGNIFDNLSDEKKYVVMNRYMLSKLLVMLMIRELAAHMSKAVSEGKPAVILNCPAPGLCKTSLIYDDPNANGAIRFMTNRIGREPEIGTRPLVYGVISGPETHGQYLSENAVKAQGAWLKTKQGAEVQKKMWKEMMERLEKVRPGLETLI